MEVGVQNTISESTGFYAEATYFYSLNTYNTPLQIQLQNMGKWFNASRYSFVDVYLTEEKGQIPFLVVNFLYSFLAQESV